MISNFTKWEAQKHSILRIHVALSSLPYRCYSQNGKHTWSVAERKPGVSREETTVYLGRKSGQLGE